MRSNQRLAQLWLDALATELGASAGTYTEDLNCYLVWLDENSLGLDEVGLEHIRDYIAVLDTRGYVVRDALVFARSTPLLTSAPGEQRTARDGWVRLRMTLHADFPLGGGRSVQFFVRVRKPADDLLAGVSSRRLVQVATAGSG